LWSKAGGSCPDKFRFAGAKVRLVLTLMPATLLSEEALTLDQRRPRPVPDIRTMTEFLRSLGRRRDGDAGRSGSGDCHLHGEINTRAGIIDIVRKMRASNLVPWPAVGTAKGTRRWSLPGAACASCASDWNIHT